MMYILKSHILSLSYITAVTDCGESATLVARLLDSSETEKEWSPSRASSSMVEISTHASELSVALISKVTEKSTG